MKIHMGEWKYFMGSEITLIKWNYIMGSKRSEVEQKLHHGERNYIMGSKMKWNCIMGSKMEWQKYIMERENKSWEVK